MSIEELKELYKNQNGNVDNETLWWSKSVFGVNTKGDAFWSIGIDYMYELVKLLGNKGIYDRFSIDQLCNLLDNEKYIQELLDKTSDSEYIKLKEILALSDAVKKVLYNYIKSKLLQIKSEEWENGLNKHVNVEYTKLTHNSFTTNENGRYVAKNVLFNNLKVDEIEILGDISVGLKTLDDISEQYKDFDLKRMCVEMLMKGDVSDWDDNATSFDKCYELISNKIDNIVIYNNVMDLHFNTDNEAFGGHTPVLNLTTEKDKKSVFFE